MTTTSTWTTWTIRSTWTTKVAAPDFFQSNVLRRGRCRYSEISDIVTTCLRRARVQSHVVEERLDQVLTDGVGAAHARVPCRVQFTCVVTIENH